MGSPRSVKGPALRLAQRSLILRAMPSFEGAWKAPQYSGGVPPAETWAANPQFALHPATDGASYTIELIRHAQTAAHRVGLWVMKGDSMEERKMEYKGMVEKTKLNASERRTLTLPLPLRDRGLPYVIFCATQDAGLEGTFTLTVTSVEDENFRVVPLQPDPSAGPGVRPPPAGTTLTAGSSRAPKPLGSFNPAGGGGGGGGAPPLLKGQTTFGGQAPDNVPVVETVGQGLSKKLEAEAKQAIEEAVRVPAHA